MIQTPGRRIQIDGSVSDPYSQLQQAGDYCGPIMGYTGNYPAVFFLLPCLRDIGIHPSGVAVRHVSTNMHRVSEEGDGTLTISDSIRAYGPDGKPLWHGYLTKGVWSEIN